MYVVSKLDNMGAIYSALQEELRTHSRNCIHGGKTNVWNQCGSQRFAARCMRGASTSGRSFGSDSTSVEGSELPDVE